MSIPVSPGTQSKISRYWKAVIAAVGFVTIVGVEVVQAFSNGAADGTFDTADLVTVVVAGITAFGVWAKANVKPADEPYNPAVSEAESNDQPW